MYHLVMLHSYIVNSSGDLNKEVEVVCYRGCMGHWQDHEYISNYFVHDRNFIVATICSHDH